MDTRSREATGRGAVGRPKPRYDLDAHEIWEVDFVPGELGVDLVGADAALALQKKKQRLSKTHKPIGAVISCEQNGYADALLPGLRTQTDIPDVKKMVSGVYAVSFGRAHTEAPVARPVVTMLFEFFFEEEALRQAKTAMSGKRKSLWSKAGKAAKKKEEKDEKDETSWLDKPCYCVIQFQGLDLRIRLGPEWLEPLMKAELLEPVPGKEVSDIRVGKDREEWIARGGDDNDTTTGVTEAGEIRSAVVGLFVRVWEVSG